TESSITNYAPANGLNQYPSVAGDAYEYDYNGNLTSGLYTSATCDALNRVTQIVSGATTNNYWNDPLNRQIQKEVGSTKTGLLYDGVQLIAEYNAGGLVNRYIPSDRLDEVLVQIATGDTITYLHQDRIGSTVAQTDSSGAVLNKYAYSPFGVTESLAGTIFGFTGQRYDAEIGLYNYRMRYYSPTLGRFVQPDPLLFRTGDLNIYTYVGNDALNCRDPLGTDRMVDLQFGAPLAATSAPPSTFVVAIHIDGAGVLSDHNGVSLTAEDLTKKILTEMAKHPQMEWDTLRLNICQGAVFGPGELFDQKQWSDAMGKSPNSLLKYSRTHESYVSYLSKKFARLGMSVEGAIGEVEIGSGMAFMDLDSNNVRAGNEPPGMWVKYKNGRFVEAFPQKLP
ncbi:MAG: RHS repeat-associated core domain-containing protein, partial [Candidatus Obscuribacterales bacterium]|nr:RHS repeat-associated core domain-containing protein [Candidatus Obscuribacterales bacterium]